VPDFTALIDRLNAASGPERARIEAEIWESFGVEQAMLVLDMSQFSLSVRRDGILAYLGHIRRMQQHVAPVVEAHEGRVVKFVADNLFATFPTVASAVEAAIAMNHVLARARAGFGIAIGIDYGRFLLLPEGDAWGDAINVACKLGEDLARPGEVLLTQAARAALPSEFPHPLDEQRVSISGLELVVHGLRIG
jgi:adenylate cyclase